jgi:hypothetical protein
MSKEIINPHWPPHQHWQEGYEQGVLSGYTKSIVLIRHLQRTLHPNGSISPKKHQRDILDEAMVLISEKITGDSGKYNE